MRMETWPQSVGLTSESTSHLHNIKMKVKDSFINFIVAKRNYLDFFLPCSFCDSALKILFRMLDSFSVVGYWK
jgi:hypothetical protein